MKNNIKALRKREDLTQEELANILDVTRQTINAIENDKYNPTLDLALKISKYFDLAVEEVFYDKEEKGK